MPELQQTYLYLCECVRAQVCQGGTTGIRNKQQIIHVSICDQSMDAKFFFLPFLLLFWVQRRFGKTCRFFHKYKNDDQSQFVHILNKRLLDNPINVSARPL